MKAICISSGYFFNLFSCVRVGFSGDFCRKLRLFESACRKVADFFDAFFDNIFVFVKYYPCLTMYDTPQTKIFCAPASLSS